MSFSNADARCIAFNPSLMYLWCVDGSQKSCASRSASPRSQISVHSSCVATTSPVSVRRIFEHDNPSSARWSLQPANINREGPLTTTSTGALVGVFSVLIVNLSCPVMWSVLLRQPCCRCDHQHFDRCCTCAFLMLRQPHQCGTALRTQAETCRFCGFHRISPSRIH